MRPPIAALAALAVLLAAAAPLVAGQSTPTEASARKTSFVTFYGHVFDTVRTTPMPMNTEFPAGENDFSGGYGGTCSDTYGGTPVLQTCEEYANNEVWFVSTAGFVDIQDDSDFDYAKLHNERGLTKPVIFDTAQNIIATFYMSADAHGWPRVICEPDALGPPYVDLDDVPWLQACFNWDPGALPQWQVEATLYAAVLGEHGSGASEAADIDNAYRSGALEVIAQGVSAPTDITSLEFAGFPTVWEFEIDLGPAAVKEIPKEKSLVWRVQWWAALNGDRFLEDNALSWNVNSGEFFPPRIVLPVKNAFDVELVLPQFVHNKLVLHGILNTPWGSYDANPESVQLAITSLDGSRTFEPTRVQTFADYSVAHGGHYRPVNVTYVWDYQGDKLPAGDYKATISASNHQGSAAASCEATFRIRANGAGESLTVGRCGTVSEGAEKFANQQGGAAESTTPDGLKLLRTVGLAGDSVRAVPSAAPLLALALVALAALGRWRA